MHGDVFKYTTCALIRVVTIKNRFVEKGDVDRCANRHRLWLCTMTISTLLVKKRRSFSYLQLHLLTFFFLHSSNFLLGSLRFMLCENSVTDNSVNNQT